MKALVVIASLALAAGCGKKGNPERPGSAAAPQQRTVIGATTSTEAPATPRRERTGRDRRFILDGLL